jgi:hypothetical protein
MRDGACSRSSPASQSNARANEYLQNSGNGRPRAGSRSAPGTVRHKARKRCPAAPAAQPRSPRQIPVPDSGRGAPTTLGTYRRPRCGGGVHVATSAARSAVCSAERADVDVANRRALIRRTKRTTRWRVAARDRRAALADRVRPHACAWRDAQAASALAERATRSSRRLRPSRIAPCSPNALRQTCAT